MIKYIKIYVKKCVSMFEMKNLLFQKILFIYFFFSENEMKPYHSNIYMSTIMKVKQ